MRCSRTTEAISGEGPMIIPNPLWTKSKNLLGRACSLLNDVGASTYKPTS